jgi:muramoyltetrapeptide carboxypeptidase
VSLAKPARLAPGSRVGVCSPSGSPDRARLDAGLATLRGLGLEVVETPGARGRRRFHSGPLGLRLAELQSLLDDPGIAAVFATRGGAGCQPLLPRLDLRRFRERPKLVVGYSDLTFLHLLLQREGFVSVHGPMAALELAEPEAWHEPSLRAALFGETAYASEEDELLALRDGVAEGRLVGGCLSILASACGTPFAFAPDEDCVLFLEDLDEPPYRIERHLGQLAQAGALARVKGVVLGDFRGCSPALDADYTLEDVVLEALGTFKGPVALGLSSGHTRNPNVALPLGVTARLSCGSGRALFEVLEEPVA